MEDVDEEDIEADPVVTEPETLGHGKRIRKKPTNLIPSMGGKRYDEGVIHLTYRGAKFKMDHGVIHLNLGDSEAGPALMSEFEVDEHILGVILVQQFNLKKGLGLFGNKAEVATLKELKQIHDMGTYVLLKASKMSRKDKMQALSSLMFIVEKRDGRVKARKCAVGSKQRTFEGYKKSDSASPTVHTDAVIITSTLDAHEGRDVATADMPGAYLHTDNNQHMVMLLRGKLAELMVQVDPKLYRKYITTSSKGEPISEIIRGPLWTPSKRSFVLQAVSQRAKSVRF